MSTGCQNRFTHANRRCSLHPKSGVTRDKDSALQGVLKVNTTLNNASKEIIEWLKDHCKVDRGQSVKRIKKQPSERFRARKLSLELDAVDNSGCNEENSGPVWKKKRAALELQAKKEATYDVDTEGITKDKLLGALALMELANSPVVDISKVEGYCIKNINELYQETQELELYRLKENDIQQI